jgi:hypothetical protein
MLDILWKHDGWPTTRIWGASAIRSSDVGGGALAARARRGPVSDVERHFTIGHYPGLDLERAGWARPVRVDGGTEQWWVHRDALGLLDEDPALAAAIGSLASFAGADRGCDSCEVTFGLC